MLAWLAYVIGRILDAWLKLQSSSERPAKTRPEPSPTTIEHQSQALPNSQTHIEHSQGTVLSGAFHGPVTVGATPTPSTSAPAAAPPDADQSELDRLYQLLRARFSREELRTLCFRLGVEYDDLPAEGREAKARELVMYMNRRTGGLAQLRSAIQKTLELR